MGRIADVVKHEIVANAAEAELMVTDSPKEGFELLKENEKAKLVIIVMPGKYTMKEDRVGAQALAKNFPGRVDICNVIEDPRYPDEEMIVPYIMSKGAVNENLGS